MNIRGVLFDLDGTLLNSLADIAGSANRVLESHGFPTHPLAAYRYFVGDGLASLIARILPTDRREDEVLLGQCIEAFGADYRTNWNVQSILYDGIPEMLGALVRRGLVMGVFSNKPHEFTRLCVEHYLAAFPFAAVLGIDERRPRKPDPAGAWEVARRFELSPDACLYLGDTAVDMQTAQRAGMYPVGALWGFREASELERAGARELLAHPSELVCIIDSLNQWRGV